MSLFHTAFDLINENENQNNILFGCKSIDDVLGGLPKRGITEISGEAGSGKTQLCLNLALEGTINRMKNVIDGQTIYLTCGEGSFPIKRLLQLSKTHERIHRISHQRFLDNINLKSCLNQDDTVDVLFRLIPLECQSKKINLIILDSLAGLVRFEYDNKKESEVIERTSFLFKIASQLKWLSDTFRISIVVVNQVTMKAINEYFSENIPALGLAWTHCVNTRISLKKSYQYLSSNDIDLNNQNHAENQTVEESNPHTKKAFRILKVEFSPYIPSVKCEFLISEEGLQSVT